MYKNSSLLVTVLAQFTTKMTNSKKAIYFLWFMSYSTKSYMLSTSKRFVFSYFTYKKALVQKNGGGLAPQFLFIYLFYLQ